MPRRGQTCKCGRHIWSGKCWKPSIAPSPGELEKLEKPEKPLKIVFAPMDCKNQTAVSTDYPYMPYRGRNTDEERVLRDMELEYLLAIHDLRLRLREKYMPLLVEDRRDPECEVRRVCDEHFEAHRAEWDRVRWLYYT